MGYILNYIVKFLMFSVGVLREITNNVQYDPPPSIGSTVLVPTIPHEPIRLCGIFEVYEQSGYDTICSGDQISAPGCHCKRGYVRLNKYSQCQKGPCPTPVCGPNELYSDTVPVIKRTCENYPNYVVDFTNTTRGCTCDYIHVYDRVTGRCVKPEFCSTPPKCEENEVYQDSGFWMTCQNYQTGGDRYTYPFCYCKPGFIRDLTSVPFKCVPISNCECGENQMSVASVCINTCNTRKTSRCDYRASNNCICKPGYVFENINSTKCIKEEHCPNPPVCLSPNQEVYVGKDNYCPTGDLSNTYYTVLSGCYCKEGYVLILNTSSFSSQYNCEPMYKCPEVTCPQNASLRTSSVDRTCMDIANGVTPDTNITWHDCFCNVGYVRDLFSGNCVLKEECIVCGKNEQFNQWGYCADTCDTYNPSSCQIYTTVEGGSCECKPGFIIESVSSKKCIPINECPIPIDCGPNKIFKINGSEETCEERNRNRNTQGPENKHFAPGCYCIDGFIPRPPLYGDCVPEESCPVCGEHQTYSLDPGFCANTCDDYRIPSADQFQCNSSKVGNTCYCEYPYVAKSATDATCVHITNCSYICGENEVFRVRYPTDDCVSYLQNNTNKGYGGPGCYCKKGYLRAVNNQRCVPVAECIACGEEEEYTSKFIGDSTCENWAILKNTFVDLTLTSESSFNVIYRGACTCKEGYARNFYNECVSTCDCPSPPPCGPNQEFQETGEDEYCTGLDATNQDACRRCYCKLGFVRNYKNECIPEEECPNCEENDSNSFFSPCVHCYDYCNGTRHCSWSCLGDCDCKPGYMYSKAGTCVPSSDCNV